MQPLRLRTLYAIDVPGKVFQQALQAFLMGASGAALCLHFTASALALRELLPWLPPQVRRLHTSSRALGAWLQRTLSWPHLQAAHRRSRSQFHGLAVGFLASLCLLLSFAYAFTLFASLHTSLFLRPRVALLLLSLLPSAKWASASLVLDLGSGRGTLLCCVARHLRRLRSGARAVGFDSWPPPKPRPSPLRWLRPRGRGVGSAPSGAAEAASSAPAAAGPLTSDEASPVPSLPLPAPPAVAALAPTAAGSAAAEASAAPAGSPAQEGMRQRPPSPDRLSPGSLSPRGPPSPSRALPAEGTAESEVGSAANDEPPAGTMLLTLRAAAAEGVGALVTCKMGSFRALPFRSGLFDVAVSALKLHQIALRVELQHPQVARSERRRVLEEALRVLKPGGALLLWDFAHVAADAELFSSAGFVKLRVHAAPKAFLQETAIMVARRPEGWLGAMKGKG